MIELGSLVSALQILPSRDVAKGPETLEKLLVQKSEADLATFKSVGDKAGVNVSMDARCCLALAVSGGLERLGARGVDTYTPFFLSTPVFHLQAQCLAADSGRGLWSPTLSQHLVPTVPVCSL